MSIKNKGKFLLNFFCSQTTIWSVQYEKAVDKSRMAEALAIMSSIKEATIVADLEKGESSFSGNMLLADLSINVPGEAGSWENSKQTKDWIYSMYSPGGGPVAYYKKNVSEIRDEQSFYLCIYIEDDGNSQLGVIKCGYNGDKGGKLCKISSLPMKERPSECW